MGANTFICRGCSKPFERSAGRGRPAVRCSSCRGEGSVFVVSDEKESHEKTVVRPSAPPNTSAIVVSIDPLASISSGKKEKQVNGETYCLMVGNMGVAYVGEDEREAIRQFTNYSKASSLGYGQIGFEAVQLWKRKEDVYELFKDFKIDRTP